MMPVALDIGGMEAAFNPMDQTWLLSAGSKRYTVRPWTWGERRQIIASACFQGNFDRSAFLSGLVATLFTPAPPDHLVPLFSLAALRLMSVPEDPDAIPLEEAERRMAEQFHWPPSMLKNEIAGDLDALLPRMAQPAAHRAPSGVGWNSILLDEHTGGGAE